ncbi:MAG TPA: hypothetical protein VIY73_21800, partial [Polyangiaceae bacterium]
GAPGPRSRVPATVVRALPWVLAALCACGGARRSMLIQPNQESLDVRPLSVVLAGDAGAPRAAVIEKSHRVGTIERKAIGPFEAHTAQGGLVAWIETADRGGGQELTVVPTSADGAAMADARVVNPVPQEATALFVRPTGGTRGGWLVAWSALLDRGESLSIVGIAPDGSTRNPAADVQRTTDHIKWADVVPLARGALVVWAEEPPTGAANVLAAPVDSDGKPRGVPVRVARSVSGWAAVKTDDGAGVALVMPVAGDTTGAGSLSWMRLDGDGRPAGAAVVVTPKATVSDGVDAVAIPGGVLFAWTDRRGEDEQVMLATVDAAGKVEGPHRAMDTVGGTELAGLASGPAGAALLWHEPRGKEREMRTAHVALVSTQGEPSAQPVTALDVGSKVAPELAATEHGFAVLANARSCVTGESVGACDGPMMPTYVRLDARLTPVQAESLYVSVPREEATLGWSLRCAGDACVALAATGDNPTPIYTVDLAPRASPFALPVVRPPPPDAPHVTGVTTVASGEPYIQVDATTIERATLLATLTTAVDTIPKGQTRVRHGALAVVRAFDAQGRALAEPTLLTSRGLPVGGVAIAAGGKPDDGAVVAWVARDADDPQVHLSHVDALGKKLGEVQLTHARGDASDVAVAWAGDGWIVGWVDGRDGNGEVYAVKVDRELNRTGPEQRITKAPGDAGDVAIAVKGETAWMTWSDPRESPREGTADVYATTLRARDAKKTGEDVRVLATAAHSRSPEIVAVGDGALVAWIEDAPSGLDVGGMAMLARLDRLGHVAGVPGPLPMAAKGQATGVSLGVAGDGARAVVVRTAKDDVTLDGMTLRPDGAAGTPWALLDLDAPGSFEVSTALTPDAVFFDDVGAGVSDHRVRRAAISWTR